MNEDEAAAAILDIAGWLSYAEGSAEQRLYSFFMAASLLLLACATVFASADAPNLLAALLAVCGLVLSILWVIVGTRQGKFHQRLGLEAQRLLQGQSTPEKFALKYIHDIEFAAPGQERGATLNGVERRLSTRTSTWLVPAFFVLVFLLILAFSLAT